MPNLLDLPREIRDHIYSYCTKDMRLRWTQEENVWRTNLFAKVDIQVNGGPLLNLLLTHSRIKEEYMDTATYKRLSVTLRLAPLMGRTRSTAALGSEYNVGHGRHFEKSTDGLLASIADLTIYIEGGSVYGYSNAVRPSLELHLDVNHLIKLFSARAANIRSLRYALQCMNGRIIHDPGTTYPGPHWVPLPPSLSTIASMPLVQRVEGYRLTHSYEPGDEILTLYHECTDFACYAYGKDPKAVQFWCAEDILSEWPNSKLPTPTVDSDYDDFDDLPWTLKGWKERRGREEALAWF